MEHNTTTTINTHCSLPKNYVTLAQLQERWLKQQQQKNDQPHQKPEEEEEAKENEEHVAVPPPTTLTVSRSPPAGRKTRSDSRISDRRAVKAVSVKYRRKSETADLSGDSSVKVASAEDRPKSDTGEENADVAGKLGKLKKKRRKNYHKTGKNKQEMHATEEEGEKVAVKTAIGLNDEKKVTTVKEEGNAVAVKTTIGSEVAVKTTIGSKVAVKTTIGSGLNDEKSVSTVKEVAVKTTIGIGLNHEKKVATVKEEGKEVAVKTTIGSGLNDGKKVTTLEEEIERKIGGLSVNPRNWKQKGMLRVWKSKSSEPEKTTKEREVNDEKDVKTTTVEEEVGKKFGGVSVSSEGAKQNGRVRRMNGGYRRFQQDQGNYRGRGNGFGNSRDENRANFRGVWVRKNGGDGEFEH